MNLDERARRAAASVREQAATVDAEAVLERIRGSRERPRWLLPAGAAVAVALVIAVVAVVVPRVATGPVIGPIEPGDPSSSEDPTEDATEPTERSRPPSSIRWQRVMSGAFEGPGDDRMRAVAQVAAGTTVAVGRHADGPGVWWRDPLRPADDPDAWRQVGTDLCGEASCELHDVTAFRERFVIVGTLDGLPKIWRSDDGLTWQRVDLERRDPGTAGETELTAVVDRGADGIVSFGVERHPDGERPVVFTSTTGETWSEAPVDFAFDEAGAHVIDAAGVGAVLQIGDGTSLLVETDGTWSPRDLEGDGFDIITTFVHAIALADDGGLWMLGSVWTPDGQDGRVWHSTDGGTSWTPMPGDLGGPGDQHVTSVAIAGGVAVGYETDAEGRPSPVAWGLSDGAWSRLPGGTAFDDPGAMADAVQTDGHSATVVGTAGGGGDANSGAVPADAAVWTVNLEGPGD